MQLNFNNPLTIAGLLIIALSILYFLKRKPKKIETQEENTKEQQVAVSKVDTADKADDMELAAAIMGALSAYLNMPASKLRIRSIKRVDGTTSTWRRESMEEV
jgi:LPXTG-motif cell wall-anchored protein